jgi:hypothetical protein
LDKLFVVRSIVDNATVSVINVSHVPGPRNEVDRIMR